MYAATEAALLQGLVAELQRSEETLAPVDARTIYREESGGPDHYTHFYAVWTAFDGVDRETRSRLLMSAIREVLGAGEALRVSMAMGLTPDEVARMGLGLQ